MCVNPAGATTSSRPSSGAVSVPRLLWLLFPVPWHLCCRARLCRARIQFCIGQMPLPPTSWAPAQSGNVSSPEIRVSLSPAQSLPLHMNTCHSPSLYRTHSDPASSSRFHTRSPFSHPCPLHSSPSPRSICPRRGHWSLRGTWFLFSTGQSPPTASRSLLLVALGCPC